MAGVCLIRLLLRRPQEFGQQFDIGRLLQVRERSQTLSKFSVLLRAVTGQNDHLDSRVILLASGVSVAPAVRCAEERPDVRGLVLFPGLIEQSGRDFLLRQPDLPLLLLAAGGETRGRDLVRQYAVRFTGPAQEHVEFAPTADDPADWLGTDGLARDDVRDVIVWFLERRFPAPDAD